MIFSSVDEAARSVRVTWRVLLFSALLRMDQSRMWLMDHTALLYTFYRDCWGRASLVFQAPVRGVNTLNSYDLWFIHASSEASGASSAHAVNCSCCQCKVRSVAGVTPHIAIVDRFWKFTCMRADEQIKAGIMRLSAAGGWWRSSYCCCVQCRDSVTGARLWFTVKYESDHDYQCLSMFINTSRVNIESVCRSPVVKQTVRETDQFVYSVSDGVLCLFICCVYVNSDRESVLLDTWSKVL